MRSVNFPANRTQGFAQLRHDFPVLNALHQGKPLAFLDSAASAQKPRQVIERLTQFYSFDYANVHRGIYPLSERASLLFEQARATVKTFIHAKLNEEIIFVRGTTEAINLVAQSYGYHHWQAGDEIIISAMEHHANIVPWYLLAKQIGVVLKIIPISDSGEINIPAYQALFSERTKLVAFTHVSNVLGTITPVKTMTQMAHALNVPVLVDGAQAVTHLHVDVQDLNCDFYAFSSHKLYGPTGIGVLYAKQAMLAKMMPYQGGGNMIAEVNFDAIQFAEAPNKFEAGTPHIAGAVGLAAAIDYVQAAGLDNIYQHDQQLLRAAEAEMAAISGLRILGTAKDKVGIISFVIDAMHPHDLATVLAHEGVAVRAGHHCAMPLMQRFNVPATVRVSFALYNNEADIKALIAALKTAKRIFS